MGEGCRLGESRGSFVYYIFWEERVEVVLRRSSSGFERMGLSEFGVRGYILV